MERNEALNYLKELLKVCNDMSPEAVSFEKPKTAESEGVTLRIKGTIQEVDRQAVKEIAKKHSLSVTEEKGEVIIKNDYAPSLPRRIENKKGSQ